MGSEAAAVDESAAEPRAEGHDEFRPFARNDAGRCDFGVVEDECGNGKARVQGRFHVQAVPRRFELGVELRVGAGFANVVRGVDDDAAPDHSRHAEGDPFESLDLRRMAFYDFEQILGRERIPHCRALRRGRLEAVEVKEGGLDPAASAVHGQSQRIRLAGRLGQRM